LDSGILEGVVNELFKATNFQWRESRKKKTRSGTEWYTHALEVEDLVFRAGFTQRGRVLNGRFIEFTFKGETTVLKCRDFETCWAVLWLGR
jgi:hypothetical protein